MPEVICTTVYQFPELSEVAKDKARSWYRELGPHDDWWDAVYEDFERICDILRISRKWGTDFTRCGALVSREVGQPQLITACATADYCYMARTVAQSIRHPEP